MVRARRKCCRHAVGLLLIGLVGTGCFPIPIHKEFKRERSLAQYAPTIVKGVTTRREIERDLGVADVEAVGSRSVVNSGTPLARYFEFWKARPEWKSYVPYSSLDENHVALLYLEIDMNQLTIGSVVGLAGFRLTGVRNKLLVFVHKQTGTVEDLAYLEESGRKE